MTNFVLVHGVWSGGWCYRETAAALRRNGHSVFTPTLTGLGERAHQGGEAITLETHIRDVVGCLQAEELDEVVLLGHSYSGMVITGVADRLPAKIKLLVYLDAFVPENGQSMSALLNEALVAPVAAQSLEGFRGSARQNGGMTSPLPAEVFNVTAAKREWLNRRSVPQAFATIEMPLLLTGESDAVQRKLYILADGWDPNPGRYFANKYAGVPGWETARLPCGHYAMLDMPEELAELLVAFA